MYVLYFCLHSSQKVVNLVNVGDHAIDFSDVQIDSSFFHHSFRKPVSVVPGGNLTVQVVFLPAVP